MNMFSGRIKGNSVSGLLCIPWLIFLFLPLYVFGQYSSTVISRDFFNGPGEAMFFEYTGEVEKPFPPIFVSSKKPNFNNANIYKHEDVSSEKEIKIFLVSENDLKIIIGNVGYSLSNLNWKKNTPSSKSKYPLFREREKKRPIVDIGIIENNKLAKWALTRDQAISELSLVQNEVENTNEDLLDAILYFKKRLGANLTPNENEKTKKGLRTILNY